MKETNPFHPREFFLQQDWFFKKMTGFPDLKRNNMYSVMKDEVQLKCNDADTEMEAIIYLCCARMCREQ